MKVLKEIVEQWGFVTSEQIEELEKHFPDTPLIIRWGGLPREKVLASEVAEKIAHVEEMNRDYVRDVFIQSEHMTKLREVFGLTQPY